MQIPIHKKYRGLFKLFSPEYHPEVDTVIVTGGRSSGKSYSVAIHSVVALTSYNWSVLYTRYTNMSIEDSVKPEVSQKIELLGYEQRVKDTQTHIECGNNRIAFKGIKTGSGVQTAALKSLQGFNCFVVDEAEELPDYKTFKKVFYSIRSSTKRNLTILILNPTSKQHWIYEEFFEKRGIEGGFNGVHENVMYIHTSYLDVDPKFIPENIRKDYERLQRTNTEEYENIVMGGWVENPEGILLPKSSLTFEDMSKITPDFQFDYRFACGDPADLGGDKFSIPFMFVSLRNGIKVYVRSVIHNGHGIMHNCPVAAERLKLNAMDECYIETNGVGLSAYHQLVTLMRDSVVKVKAWPVRAEKELRILSNYEFIRDHFVFDLNYKDHPEYTSFISDLTGYKAGGDNKHKKDAIDVLATAATILKVKFRKQIY